MSRGLKVDWDEFSVRASTAGFSMPDLVETMGFSRNLWHRWRECNEVPMVASRFLDRMIAEQAQKAPIVFLVKARDQEMAELLWQILSKFGATISSVG